MKKTVLILTKTNWEETPRIRHQITQMLYKRGFNLIFFEKNSFTKFRTKHRVENGIKFYSHWEPVHHQLRAFSIVVKLNNFFTKKIIKRVLKTQHFDAILNFCYDYSFLKNLFPAKRIVTFINDDFELQAKPWMKKSISNQLKFTLENSDSVLTVSYPLLEKLKLINVNTHLLLPWANIKYSTPRKYQKREAVIYYGYINHRVDFSILIGIAKIGIKLLLVGPVENNVNKEKLNELLSFNNVSYKKASALNEINLDNVCCSVLSYDRKIKSVNAATMSNRGFNLLSFGIPLLYVDLPYLIKAPKQVLMSCSSQDDWISGINYYQKNFDHCQKKVELFLQDHYEENRFKIIEQALL